MPARRRSNSRRADWVYRANSFDGAGAIIDDQGTYAPQVQTLATGTALAGVLYDSHNYTAGTVSPTVVDAPTTRVYSPARAEGRRAFIHRTEGTMFYRASTWALGSRLKWGIRFGIFEQDPIIGAFLIDPNYSMWTGGILPVSHAAMWANDRKWQQERRVDIGFSDNSPIFTARFRVPVRRSLAPNECYGFYLENPGAESVTILFNFWFRTLVSDEP